MTDLALAPSPSLSRSLWRFRSMFVAIVAASVTLVALLSVLLAPSPRVVASVAFANPQAENVIAPGVVGDQALARYTSQRADFLTSDDVLVDVARVTGEHSLAVLRGRLSIQPSTTSNTVTITATGPTVAEAATLVSAVIGSYRAATLAEMKRQTDAVVGSIQASVSRLGGRLKNHPSTAQAQSLALSISGLQNRAANVQTGSIEFGDGVEWATAPTLAQPSGLLSSLKQLAIGSLLGLALGGVAVWLAADRAREVGDSRRAQELLQCRYLGKTEKRSRRRSKGKTEESSSVGYQVVAAAYMVHSRAKSVGVLTVSEGDDVDYESSQLVQALESISGESTVEGSDAGAVLDSTDMRSRHRSSLRDAQVMAAGAEGLRRDGVGGPATVTSAIEKGHDTLDSSVTSAPNGDDAPNAMALLRILRLGGLPLTELAVRRLGFVDEVIVLVTEHDLEREVVDASSALGAFDVRVAGYVFVGG